jgi:glycosyltransferase involved in cell wall biosynthesis
VALTALKGDKTLAEPAQEFDVHANQIVEWKQQIVGRAAKVFGGGSASKQGLARYLTFYSQRRPLSALDRETSNEFYYESLPKLQHAVQSETGRTSLIKQEILFKQSGPLLMDLKSITVVIPAYKSETALPILVERLDVVLKDIIDNYEIIIIDDCSPDNTWQVLKRLKQSFQRLKIVRLARNSGQHNAILCGLGMAQGDIVITMDDDLQNLPEDIPLLVSAINEGYDLAIGSYEVKKHSATRNLGGKLVDDLQRHIFRLPKDFQLTSFRAIRKAIVDNVVAMGGVFPYITSMFLSHTSKCINVPVRHGPRQFGQSNYNIERSLLLVFNLLFGYSSYPLYFVIGLCIAALGFSASLAVWVLWKVLVHGSPVQGWASTMATISFFNALILLALVIHGLYLSRMTQQITRSRVSFTIGEVHE